MATNLVNMSLKHRYRRVLIGFEKYSFSEEQLQVNVGNFEMALADYDACQKCDGSVCKGTVNLRCKNMYYHQAVQSSPCGPECYGTQQVYFALDHRACKDRNPGFTIYNCPGSAARKQQMIDAISPKRREPYRDD